MRLPDPKRARFTRVAWRRLPPSALPLLAGAAAALASLCLLLEEPEEPARSVRSAPFVTQKAATPTPWDSPARRAKPASAPRPAPQPAPARPLAPHGKASAIRPLAFTPQTPARVRSLALFAPRRAFRHEAPLPARLQAVKSLAFAHDPRTFETLLALANNRGQSLSLRLGVVDALRYAARRGHAQAGAALARLRREATGEVAAAARVLPRSGSALPAKR